MKVRELIEKLKTLDPELIVVGSSETGIWEIEPEDVSPTWEYVNGEDEEKELALLLGYCHG